MHMNDTCTDVRICPLQETNAKSLANLVLAIYILILLRCAMVLASFSWLFIINEEPPHRRPLESNFILIS